MEPTYTIFIIDGGFDEIENPCTDSIRFCGLGVAEALAVGKIALEHGMDVVVRGEAET